MRLSIGQTVTAWAILIICLVAVPVGALYKQSTGSKTDTQSVNKGLRALLKSRDELVVVKLYDLIADDDVDSLFSHSGSVASAKRSLRDAIEDEHIKGVLFRVNSPGGTVATSQEIYSLIRQLKKIEKPVVVSMGDLAASGGYYVSCCADRIYAEPGTLTGSIGVIISLLNLQGIEEKLGIKPEVVKSGEFKDMASPNKPLSEEDRKILQDLIDDSYGQFVKAVADGRGMDEVVVRKIADGRVYSGQQALKNGLVDELGGYDEALAHLQSMAKKKYKLKKDLPVDDSSGFSTLARLFEEVKSPLHISNCVNDYFPPYMQGRFYKQPLWIMP